MATNSSRTETVQMVDSSWDVPVCLEVASSFIPGPSKTFIMNRCIIWSWSTELSTKGERGCEAAIANYFYRQLFPDAIKEITHITSMQLCSNDKRNRKTFCFEAQIVWHELLGEIWKAWHWQPRTDVFSWNRASQNCLRSVFLQDAPIRHFSDILGLSLVDIGGPCLSR